MIMDTLSGVLSGDTGPGTFSLSFDTFKLLGSDIGDLEPPPTAKSTFPTVDIRLVQPRIKKEDGEEGEDAEDDTLNTPVSTSADVSTFFCTDTTISDPVPITDILDSESCQTLRSCDALLQSYRMLWDSAEASEPLHDRSSECVGTMFPGSHSNSPVGGRISYRGSFTTTPVTSSPSDWLHSPSSSASDKSLLTPLIGIINPSSSTPTHTPPPPITPPQYAEAQRQEQFMSSPPPNNQQFMSSPSHHQEQQFMSSSPSHHADQQFMSSPSRHQDQFMSSSPPNHQEQFMSSSPPHHQDQQFMSSPSPHHPQQQQQYLPSPSPHPLQQDHQQQTSASSFLSSPSSTHQQELLEQFAVAVVSQQQTFDPVSFVTLKQQSPSYSATSSTDLMGVVSPDDVVYHRGSPVGKYQWTSAGSEYAGSEGSGLQTPALVPKISVIWTKI